jgi:hypothetical protein
MIRHIAVEGYKFGLRVNREQQRDLCRFVITGGSEDQQRSFDSSLPEVQRFLTATAR